MPRITKFKEKIKHIRPKIEIFDYSTGKLMEFMYDAPITIQETTSDSYPVRNFKVNLADIMGVQYATKN